MAKDSASESMYAFPIVKNPKETKMNGTRETNAVNIGDSPSMTAT